MGKKIFLENLRKCAETGTQTHIHTLLPHRKIVLFVLSHFPWNNQPNYFSCFSHLHSEIRSTPSDNNITFNSFLYLFFPLFSSCQINISCIPEKRPFPLSKLASNVSKACLILMNFSLFVGSGFYYVIIIHWLFLNLFTTFYTIQAYQSIPFLYQA